MSCPRLSVLPLTVCVFAAVAAMPAGAASVHGAASARPDASKRITVKEFRSLDVADTASYVISGVVESFQRTSIGLYLKDDTASVLIYGLRDSAGRRIDRSRLILKVGDSLTVFGRKTIYDLRVVEMKDARYVSSTGIWKSDAVLSPKYRDSVETLPLFCGRDTGYFSEWVSAHLCYPNISRKNGEDGVVYVEFTVGTDGKVKDVRVLEGASPALDAEALRVIRKSPRWTPGMKDGKPVQVTYSIPVIFSFDGSYE